MPRQIVPASLGYGALIILGIAVVVVTVAALTDTNPSVDVATPAAPGSPTSSCLDTWPGYPLPAPTVLPGPNLACAAIDAYGQALKASCDASCGFPCRLRSTEHTWNCTEAGADSSRPEQVWLCPRSQWDLCNPRPLSPCEIDGTHCDATPTPTTCSGPDLVQQFWPTQISSYFGVRIGEARRWNVGDEVSIGGEEFTINCIAIGDTDGGETHCGNTRATFDIVRVNERPSRTYPSGTCVES